MARYRLAQSIWSGLVGKGKGLPEPQITFEEMLRMTTKADFQGRKFDCVDVICLPGHVDFAKNGVQAEGLRIAKLVRPTGLVVRSIVPAIWGGCAMDEGEKREAFVRAFKDALDFSEILISEGVRRRGDGVFRLDSNTSPEDFASGDVNHNRQLIANTFAECCDLAAASKERCAAEVEICWGGMDNADAFLELLNLVNRQNFGLQGDLSHLMMSLLGVDRVRGYNKGALLPENFAFNDEEKLEAAWTALALMLRQHLFDFHAAQNDGTVHGSGNHEATGKHCLPYDPAGKIDHRQVAPLWLMRGGKPNGLIDTLVWDGCMFPNASLTVDTFNQILQYLVEIEQAVNAKIVG